jgi:hypothetical protein
MLGIFILEEDEEDLRLVVVSPKTTRTSNVLWPTRRKPGWRQWRRGCNGKDEGGIMGEARFGFTLLCSRRGTNRKRRGIWISKTLALIDHQVGTCSLVKVTWVSSAISYPKEWCICGRLKKNLIVRCDLSVIEKKFIDRHCESVSRKYKLPI